MIFLRVARLKVDQNKHRHSLTPMAGTTSLMTSNRAPTAPEQPSLTFRDLGRGDACGQPFEAKRHDPFHCSPTCARAAYAKRHLPALRAALAYLAREVRWLENLLPGGPGGGEDPPDRHTVSMSARRANSKDTLWAGHMLGYRSVPALRKFLHTSRKVLSRGRASAMHDEVKVALREALGRVLAEFRHKSPAFASEPYLVWRRIPQGWQGEHEMRPHIPVDLGIGVNWETEASALHAALQAHHPGAFHGIRTGATGYRMFSPSELLRCVTLETITRTGSTFSHSAAVEQLIQEVSDYVDGTFIAIRFLAPLLNFKMDRTEPLALEGGIVIRQFTEEEVTRLYGGPAERLHSIREFPIDGFAFSGELREAKEPGTTNSSPGPAVSERLKEKLDCLVLGLRTFKGGPIGYNALHFFGDGFLPLLGGLTTRGYGNEYVPGGTYTISDAEIEPLQQHVRLVAAGLHSSLDAACGRLGAAQVRTEPRDKLIDAVVGLEAILLMDQGDPKYRGEMRFRFAMHYAVLHDPPAERRKQFLIARSLYDLRSRLVHGERIEEYKIGDEILPLRQVADRACDTLRFTLRRFLPGGRSPEYRNQNFWLKRYFPHGAGGNS